MRWPGTQNEIHRYLSLMAYLGVPLQGEHLEMPLTADDEAQAREVMQRHGLAARGYVCIHAGSQLRSRRWPVERFAAVGTALARDGWRIAVTGTPGERELTDALLRALPRGAVDLNGSTTLGSLAAIIRDGALLVCNDTGVSHVAAAVGAPSVVVASGSDVRRWRPLDTVLHPVLWHDVPCRPCAYDECPVGHACAQGVAVDPVLAAARRLLPERLPHAA
jgi:ADP-heptose:LPS heptosyltransferase